MNRYAPIALALALLLCAHTAHANSSNFFVNSVNGNVGVGTATMSSNELEVNGAASIGYTDVAAAQSNGLNVEGGTAIGTTGTWIYGAQTLVDGGTTNNGLVTYINSPGAASSTISVGSTASNLLVYIYQPTGIGNAYTVLSTASTNGTVLEESGTIDFTGNVGIETATVANGLDINGAASIGYPGVAAQSNGMNVKGGVAVGTTGTWIYGAEILADGNSSANGLVTYTALPGSNSLIVSVGSSATNLESYIYQTGGIGGSYTVLSTLSTNGTALEQSGTIDFTGNVGIGTPSPSATMDVQSNNGTAQGNFYKTSGGSDSYTRLNMGNAASTNYWQFAANPNNTAASSIFNIYTSSSGGINVMSLLGNGNVGIGANTPLQALDVRGLIAGNGLVSNGTPFTIASGCGSGGSAPTSLTGGATTGSFVANTTACAPVISPLPTAPNGWWCSANDITNHVIFTQTAKSTTSCTLSATVTSGDTIVFHAEAY
jgi:hypothetical protein